MGGCCSRDDDVGRMPGCKAMEEEMFYETEEDSVLVEEGGARVRIRGSCATASMFSLQGWKGVNQDAMTLWEDFAGDKDRLFCGTFDGHGPYGHKVAWHVRDTLPSKLQSRIRSLDSSKSEVDSSDTNANNGDNIDSNGGNHTSTDGTQERIASWKASIVNAFEELDKDLNNHTRIDCICSGATAVTIFKDREHLLIGNLGDSRAVLCTRDYKNQLIPIQLTVDQKPNLPSEAERIKSSKGRVFSLKEEPDVHRIWLPDEDSPGLAMARAFGDFCLKDFGLISTPQVSYWKLTEKDEFVVLATDGVWDVLSNKEVIKIVSSANKSDAAKLVVYRAVQAWRSKHPTSKVDDCTVICLFLKPPPTPNKPSSRSRSSSVVSLDTDSFRTARSEVSESELMEVAAAAAGAQQEWTALEGVTRSNSVLKIPRFAKALSRRKRSGKVEEDGCSST